MAHSSAEYNRQYRIKNKEKIALKKKEWREKNKEQIKEYNAIMWEKNKDTEERYIHQSISAWKYIGIKLRDNEDWLSIYYYYKSLDNCEVCDRPFKSSKDRQLDHDHKTGYIRDIVCNSCNQKRRYSDLGH